MNNILEMVPEVALNEKQMAAVLACGKRIQKDKIALRKASMSIGYDGAYIESLAEFGSWRLLGYEHQHAFRIGEGLGRSNWYRVLSVAKKFLEIDRDAYVQMSRENAERLSLEPPKVRFDPDNLKRAAEMTARDFADLMTVDGAHREGKPKEEKWVEVKWRMRTEQRKVIEAALEGWKSEHGIEDDVFALEMLVAEYADRPTLIGFLLQSQVDLAEQVKEASDLEQLRLDVASYVTKIGRHIALCCGEIEEEEVA